MKTIVKIILCLIVTLSSNVAHSQNYHLLILDVFEPHGCSNWCWAFTTQNIVTYYGESTPSTLDVVDYARANNLLSVDTTLVKSCYEDPLGCCVAGGLYTEEWNVLYKAFGPSMTSSQLANEFMYKQPVVVEVTGHMFIAEGISGPNIVYILDGWLGRCARDINDIYPNKSWIKSYVMRHSPNWSQCNDITDRFVESKCFSAASSINVSALFQKVPSHPVQYFQFKTNGTINLKNGFAAYPGCDLVFYTNNSSCQ